MRGRLLILDSGTVISPFLEPAREAFFAGESIAETQDRAALRHGLEVVRVKTPAEIEAARRGAPGGLVLLMLDRTYVSEKALGDFLRAAKDVAPPAALALDVNASVEYTLPLEDVLLEAGRVVHDVLRIDDAPLPPEGGDAVSFVHRIRDGARRVVVPKREIVALVPLPTIGGDTRPMLRYPVTSTVVVSVEHWVHVLWLNQIAFGIRWMEHIRRHPLRTALRALSALSLDRERILERMVVVGEGAKIHPTASLSGSFVGAGAKIGAHATVRNSILGPGVVLADHAVVLNSVIGARTLVTENSFLVSVVSYPDATIGNYKLQVSLIGRGAYVNAWAGFIDAKFVGHVKVGHKGALVSTERAFLGSVVGHRAKVAAKVLIHSGREIPNDTVIVMRPDEVVSVVPPDLKPDVPYVRDRGTLVALGQESKA